MIKVAILTASDKGSAGQRIDESGKVIMDAIKRINLPGSPKAVSECLEVILPVLPHAIEILRGDTGECARQI